MITKRIIPALYVKQGQLAGAENFEGTLVELAQAYSVGGADELTFYDLAAPAGEKTLLVKALKEVAKRVFIPLTVGGGIHSTADFEQVLACGADKVCVNSGAIKNPALVGEAARKYGDQCVVLSVDVRRVNDSYCVFTNGGKVFTDLDAIEWIHRCVGEGAGEVIVNSLDADDKKNGFDIPLLEKVCNRVNVPVIASGGAVKEEDFVDLFRKIPVVDAGLASSIFHLGKVNINNLKEKLAKNNVNVRW